MTFKDSSWPALVKVILRGIGTLFSISRKKISLYFFYFQFHGKKRILYIWILFFYAFFTLYRPSPPVSWPRRHRTSTMTSEANTEEDLDLNFSSENANTNEEQIRIEAWLDEHPDFFQEYLIRKGM